MNGNSTCLSDGASATVRYLLSASLNFFFVHLLLNNTVKIGDNAVTSSIRVARVFPELVGKKTHAI